MTDRSQLIKALAALDADDVLMVKRLGHLTPVYAESAEHRCHDY